MSVVSSPSGLWGHQRIFGTFEAHRTLLVERPAGPASQQSQFFSVKKSTQSTIGVMAPWYSSPLATPLATSSRLQSSNCHVDSHQHTQTQTHTSRHTDKQTQTDARLFGFFSTESTGGCLLHSIDSDTEGLCTSTIDPLK